MRWMAVGWVALAVGCERPSLYVGFEEDLSTARACGDLTVYSVDAGDTVALLVTLDAPLAASDAGASATTTTYLPGSATVEVRVRRNVSDGLCGQAEGEEGRAYEQIWTATEGFVHAEVTRDEGGDLADVLVQDLVLMWRTDVEPMTVDAFEWDDLPVEAPPG